MKKAARLSTDFSAQQNFYGSSWYVVRNKLCVVERVLRNVLRAKVWWSSFSGVVLDF